MRASHHSMFYRPDAALPDVQPTVSELTTKQPASKKMACVVLT